MTGRQSEEEELAKGGRNRQISQKGQYVPVSSSHPAVTQQYCEVVVVCVVDGSFFFKKKKSGDGNKIDQGNRTRKTQPVKKKYKRKTED